MPITDSQRKQAREWAAEMVAHYRSGDPLQAMPWTSDQMTKEEFKQWVASRKEAGSAIDIATCEIGWWFAYDVDPYGFHDNLPEEWQTIGRNRFVRSPESRGWVHSSDLPEDKYKALELRIARQNGRPPPREDAEFEPPF
jgi:hypothetical protein